MRRNWDSRRSVACGALCRLFSCRDDNMRPSRVQPAKLSASRSSTAAALASSVEQYSLRSATLVLYTSSKSLKGEGRRLTQTRTQSVRKTSSGHQSRVFRGRGRTTKSLAVWLLDKVQRGGEGGGGDAWGDRKSVV